MARHKPDARQQEIDFSQIGSRRRLLDHLQLFTPEGKPLPELRAHQVSPAAMFRFLKALEERMGDKQVAWPQQATMAKDMRMGVRTVGRLVQAARAMGILEVRRLRYTCVYQICWANLRDYDVREAEVMQPKSTPRSAMASVEIGHGGRPDRPWCPVRSAMVSGEIGHDGRMVNPSRKQQEPTTKRADAWEVVAEALKKEIQDWQSALERARSAGCSPAEVARLLDHYRTMQGAWHPGALHYRVRTAQPGQSATAGWPPPDPAWKRRQASALAERQRAERHRESAQARREATVDRREIDQREQQFGRMLDASSDAELAALADGNPGLMFAMRRLGPRSLVVREQLLELLADREQATMAAAGDRL